MRINSRFGFVAAMVVLVAGVAGCTVLHEPESPLQRYVPRRDAPAALADKPNIVLITADDMRPGDLEAMPFTRSVVATRGVTFTDAISPYTLCCPARAEILTGQYSHNSGVRGNTWPNGGYWALRNPGNTLPVWLRAAGYRTGFVGKYLNQYEMKRVPTCGGASWCDFLEGRQPREIPPGWSRFYGAIERIYAYWGVTLRVGVAGSQPGYERSNRYQSYLYADIVTNRIIPAFLDADETTDRPFFIWYSSATPHTRVGGGDSVPVPFSRDRTDPHSGAHWKRFADEPLPTDDHFRARFNEDVSDKAGPMPDARLVDRGEMVRLHRHRLASLLSLDDAVEQIVTKLKATGEWENTVLIFTSDNGFGLGQHRIRGKDMPYDATLRVPMIINARGLKGRYDPTATADSKVRSPFTVTTIDIPATIAALAGAIPGREPEGINMMSPGANPDFGADGHRAVLIESGSGSERRTPVSNFVGVRTDRWRWFGWDAKQNGDVLRFNARGRFPTWIEFYDVSDDAAQLTNIHGTAHAAAEQRLRQMVQQRFDCAGQECVWSAPG